MDKNVEKLITAVREEAEREIRSERESKTRSGSLLGRTYVAFFDGR